MHAQFPPTDYSTSWAALVNTYQHLTNHLLGEGREYSIAGLGWSPAISLMALACVHIHGFFVVRFNTQGVHSACSSHNAPPATVDNLRNGLICISPLSLPRPTEPSLREQASHLQACVRFTKLHELTKAAVAKRVVFLRPAAFGIVYELSAKGPCVIRCKSRSFTQC